MKYIPVYISWLRGAMPALLLLAALAGCGESGGPTGPGSRPAAVEVVSGRGQRALPGRALAAAVVARVVDAEGRPVRGVTVAFEPAAGHGEARNPTQERPSAPGIGNRGYGAGVVVCLHAKTPPVIR